MTVFPTSERLPLGGTVIDAYTRNTRIVSADVLDPEDGTTWRGMVELVRGGTAEGEWRWSIGEGWCGTVPDLYAAVQAVLDFWTAVATWERRITHYLIELGGEAGRARTLRWAQGHAPRREVVRAAQKVAHAAGL